MVLENADLKNQRLTGARLGDPAIVCIDQSRMPLLAPDGSFDMSSIDWTHHVTDTAKNGLHPRCACTFDRTFWV